MATPIGHALAGLAISSISGAPRPRLMLPLACGFAAIAPDLDVLPGLLVGQPARYHGGVSHSLGMGLVLSLGLAALFRLRGQGFSLALSLGFLSYASHLLLDWLGPDRRPPLGIPVFWPVSGEHFISPVTLLPGMHHAASTSASTVEWLQGIFSLHNLMAISVEALVIAPFLGLGLWATRRRRAAVLEEMRGRKP